MKTRDLGAVLLFGTILGCTGTGSTETDLRDDMVAVGSDAGTGTGSGSGSGSGFDAGVGSGSGSDCGTGNTYDGSAFSLGDENVQSLQGGAALAGAADVMNGHVISACVGYDIFGNVGAAAAGALDGNCHNAAVHAGTSGAIICNGNPFLTNPNPIAMAGWHTASWNLFDTVVGGNHDIKIRFYSWSGIVAGGVSRYWTYKMPPGTNPNAVPNILNNAAMFANPVWPTPANPNGVNVYVAGRTNRGWIQAETFNAFPLDGGGVGQTGFCEGQFANGTSYAMWGTGVMEDPGPNIACVWLNFAPGRKSRNPNADCHNLCDRRSRAWPGWPFSAVFKTACDNACNVCLPPGCG